MTFNFLIIAGVLSLGASLAHVFIIFGGPKWYRFFGAGEKMAVMAENKSIKPALITAGIAFVLALWAIYACQIRDCFFHFDGFEDTISLYEWFVTANRFE